MTRRLLTGGRQYFSIATLFNGGVDCGRRDELSHVPLEMICVFNIRARVLHGWGKTRCQILDICDDWIGRWRSGQVTYLPSKDYRQLCRLYYA